MKIRIWAITLGIVILLFATGFVLINIVQPADSRSPSASTDYTGVVWSEGVTVYARNIPLGQTFSSTDASTAIKQLVNSPPKNTGGKLTIQLGLSVINTH